MELAPKMKAKPPEPTPEAAHEPPAPPPPLQTAPSPKTDETEVLRAAVKMMMQALSARALLAMSFFGAFVLGGVVIFRADWLSVAALVVYSVATILPVTLIELRKH